MNPARQADITGVPFEMHYIGSLSQLIKEQRVKNKYLEYIATQQNKA